MTREHCGLFGIHRHAHAARLTYFGLYAQQHRGQESAGIAAWDGAHMHEIRALGLVHDIFNERHLTSDLQGDSAIGHVRYASGGPAAQRDAEPFLVRRGGLELAIAHNGALVNGASIRRALERQGAIFHTRTDSEIFAHLIARKLESLSLEEAILSACREARGAYSLVILANGVLIGVRDPLGIRPLSLGRLDESLVLASETCAFDLLEAEYIRSIAPGEMVVINGGPPTSLDSLRIAPEGARTLERRCIFELVYFARPDSYIFGQNVYMARKRMGMQLAREAPVEADLVMPFPDSGVYCAVGFAQASGIPYEHALIRNHYVGRTFIQPTQDMRDFSVRVKLNPVHEVIRGKRIVIVDDSIVRGTTMRTRVKKLRELGAVEIHCRIACPPVKHPCFYGVDFASRGELIAANHNETDIQRFLGLDSLSFLSLPGMLSSVRNVGYCLACFDGNYAIPLDE
jgi:amidophosphoribosyltransferase